MKTFSVAVAVAVVLAFICLQESSAAPDTEIQELKEMMSNGTLAVALKQLSEEAEEILELKEMLKNGDLAAALEEMLQESEEVPSNNRQNRGLGHSIRRRLKHLHSVIKKHCKFSCTLTAHIVCSISCSF